MSYHTLVIITLPTAFANIQTSPIFPANLLRLSRRIVSLWLFTTDMKIPTLMTCYPLVSIILPNVFVNIPTSSIYPAILMWFIMVYESRRIVRLSLFTADMKIPTLMPYNTLVNITLPTAFANIPTSPIISASLLRLSQRIVRLCLFTTDMKIPTLMTYYTLVSIILPTAFANISTSPIYSAILLWFIMDYESRRIVSLSLFTANMKIPTSMSYHTLVSIILPTAFANISTSPIYSAIY